jgi:hypothetical protein
MHSGAGVSNCWLHCGSRGVTPSMYDPSVWMQEHEITGATDDAKRRGRSIAAWSVQIRPTNVQAMAEKARMALSPGAVRPGCLDHPIHAQSEVQNNVYLRDPSELLRHDTTGSLQLSCLTSPGRVSSLLLLRTIKYVVSSRHLG